jgi:hypothetical protein
MVLQLGHIKIQKLGSLKASWLETKFSKIDESLYIYWHEIPIRFRYRQDF